MNFQNKTPDFVINFLKEKKIDYIEINYYAYPLRFSSTAGPGDGYGGNAITEFTCDAYVVDMGRCAVFLCAGMYAYVTERIEDIFGYNPKQWLRIGE